MSDSLGPHTLGPLSPRGLTCGLWSVKPCPPSIMCTLDHDSATIMLKVSVVIFDVNVQSKLYKTEVCKEKGITHLISS